MDTNNSLRVQPEILHITGYLNTNSFKVLCWNPALYTAYWYIMETPMLIWTPAVFKHCVESQYYPIYSGIYLVKLQVNTGNNSRLHGLKTTRCKKIMTPKNNTRQEEINSQRLKFR